MTVPVLRVEDHPLLEGGYFVTEFPATIEQIPSPEWLVGLLRLDVESPVSRSEEGRTWVRKLLRHGGYKPSGRGKPACEYLVRAAGEEQLGSINLPVDACNVASLHSGLPISVVDLDRAQEPLRIAMGGAEDRYVFNASGQEIDLAGLLCLWDAEGPCANAVKDSQRTKTQAETRRTLSVVWGTHAWEGQTAATVAWYQELLTKAGASVVGVEPTP